MATFRSQFWRVHFLSLLVRPGKRPCRIKRFGAEIIALHFMPLILLNHIHTYTHNKMYCMERRYTSVSALTHVRIPETLKN